MQRRLERVASSGARRQMGRWMGKGFWAILDQGLFAVSNFALNVLLARWLSPADYGAFAVAYTIFLLLGTFHTSILTEPMLVFGPSKYKDRLGPYLAVLLRGHWLFGALVGVLFAAAGLVLWRLGNSPLTPAVFGLAVASPFILFQWLMRRACYVDLQTRLAAFAGTIYMALMAAGIFGLYYYGSLGAATSLWVMAGASLVSGLWLVWQLRVDKKIEAIELVRETLSDHWRYGRWAVGVSAVAWVRNNIYLLLLPLWGGLEATGTYRALMNLILPVGQVVAPITMLALPMLAGKRSKPEFLRAFRTVALPIVAVSLAYCVVLIFLGPHLMKLLYGSQYSSSTVLLVLLGGIPLLSSMATLLARGLQALEAPNILFKADWMSLCVSLPFGIILLVTSGIMGAFIGLLLAFGVAIILMRTLLLRELS